MLYLFVACLLGQAYVLDSQLTLEDCRAALAQGTAPIAHLVPGVDLSAAALSCQPDTGDF